MQRNAWLFWSAFAVIMLWTVGVSWMWALNALPTTAESAVIIVTVAIICIIQSVALCLISQRISRQHYQRSVHDRNSAYDEQKDVAGGTSLHEEKAADIGSKDNENNSEQSIAAATWMIFIATAVNVVVAALQWNAIGGQAYLMEAEQRPWIRVDYTVPFPFWLVNGRMGGIPYLFSVENVGKSPAFGVEIQPKGFVDGAGDIHAAQRKSCDSDLIDRHLEQTLIFGLAKKPRGVGAGALSGPGQTPQISSSTPGLKMKREL